MVLELEFPPSASWKPSDINFGRQILTICSDELVVFEPDFPPSESWTPPFSMIIREDLEGETAVTLDCSLLSSFMFFYSSEKSSETFLLGMSEEISLV